MKTIELDWNDYEQVSKLFNQVKSRKLELEPGRVSKKTKQALVYNACWDIFNTDISHLYDQSNDANYYVYAHCDPSSTLIVNRSGSAAFAASLGLQSYPFYIGKGLGNRAYDLNRNETHRKVRQRIKSFNRDVEVFIIAKNKTSSEALAMESKLIDIFGILSKGGKLCNLDEGKNSEDRIRIYRDKLAIVNKYYG